MMNEAQTRQFVDRLMTSPTTASEADALNYTHTVDLKWSLWTDSHYIWKQFAPEAFETMLRCIPRHVEQFDENTTLVGFTIETASRKECRTGVVRVTPCSDSNRLFKAEVSFETEWDEPTELASTLAGDECPDDKIEEIADWLAEHELGARVLSTFEFDVLEEFLRRVDRIEDELSKLNRQQWSSICELFEKTF